MNRFGKVLVLAAAVTALVGESAVAVPASPASAPAAAMCTKQWRVTGKKVAVRKPQNNQPVASPDSPAVRYLHQGDIVTSCVEAIARTQSGPAYRKCGRGGHVWRIVRGGQVPATCLERV
ncbi:hypothetical protein ACFFKE_08245 [Streptomyces mutabilis]|uniref:hypothetical protein n=1 Tax=Streptomyces mutabilis TaxID=67332 RepID=UPI00177B20E5|nr:hypothetical protein [Streptomyces mutabilis]GGQ50191.1 hypothetical protein GCM10010279_69350 [Streptomyces mutabilis]